ncbi:hypothetical protein ATZ36_05040 [Candidatus Endomicrobiellum trichonymphae]|uniref:Uncharacterized protein n=1 Tax=Endomicrobium trichonymphae TaxID=1408204 RepID=A0A1E5III1_ENDTX|nr:hypothetical protein ATZ36_05040 [Candidatus Endomicrobium trichonymphae]
MPNSLNKNKKIADKEQAEKKIIDQQEELNEFASVSKSLSNNPTTAESLKTEITAIAQKVSNWKLEKEKLVDSNWQQQDEAAKQIDSLDRLLLFRQSCLQDEAAKQIDSLEKKLVEIQILKLNQFKTDPPVEVVIEQSKKRCSHYSKKDETSSRRLKILKAKKVNSTRLNRKMNIKTIERLNPFNHVKFHEATG